MSRLFSDLRQDFYENVEYMGDSVYIGQDAMGRIWIFLYNGITPENEICLEQDVVHNLMEAIVRIKVG